MIRVVPTGDLGLDVLLGGGWRLVKRFEERESATVVVRGGSGAGKTLMGIQVALELAKALGGDVAVGCVEILPTEYVAQLQSARPAFPRERVAMLPATLAAADGPRVYVGLLADLSPEKPDLVSALETLEASVKAAGGAPKVFIVDSLIEGYGIGASTPRIDVDDILKFAARYGYGLVLCEEVATDGPSPWVFAADTVLQLGVESRERGRWIEVRKHRFGPSATGRHELELAVRGRAEIYPSADAWRAHGATALGVDSAGRSEIPLLGWHSSFRPHTDGEFRAHTVLVTARDGASASGAAYALRGEPEDWDEPRGIDFDPTAPFPERSVGAPLVIEYLPTSHGPGKVLRVIVEQLVSRDRRRCLVVGDLAHVLSRADGEAWADVITTVASLVIAARPSWTVVFYDGREGDGGPARHRAYLDAEVLLQVRSAQGGMTATVVTRGASQSVQFAWDTTPTFPWQHARGVARTGVRIRRPGAKTWWEALEDSLRGRGP